MNSTHEKVLFRLAPTKPVDERAELFDRECRSDAGLRQRLEALLSAHKQPDTLPATQADAARPTLKLDLADVPDEALGQTLGRYKLLVRVGEAGCGAVRKSCPARAGFVSIRVHSWFPTASFR